MIKAPFTSEPPPASVSTDESGIIEPDQLAPAPPLTGNKRLNDNKQWADPLNYWDESQSTASPNNTVNASVLKTDAASTNADAVISSKGTGALQRTLADSASAGGNKRGASAVDLQSTRSAATQVASGQNATICGGEMNTASAQHAVVGGGYNNIASGNYAAILGGRDNTASAANSVAIGNQNNVGAARSIAIGDICTGITHSYALVAGRQNNSKLPFAFSYQSDQVSGAGDNAWTICQMNRASVQANTKFELWPGGQSAAYYAVASNKSVMVVMECLAWNSNTGHCIHQTVRWLCKNVGGTTSEVYAPVRTTHKDDTSGAVFFDIEADNTTDVIKVYLDASGGAGTDQWRAVALCQFQHFYYAI